MGEVYFKFFVVCHVKILSHLQTVPNNQENRILVCFKLLHREMHLRKGLSFTESERRRRRERVEKEGNKKQRSWKEAA